MAFGTGPYGIGSLGVALGLPLEEATRVLVTSRQIDFVNGTFQYDVDGNPQGMNDIHQRIGILLSQARWPQNVGNDFTAAIEAEVRFRLAVLLQPPTPDITITGVQVVPYVNGGRVKIDFTNNLLNEPDSVTV